MHYTYRDIKQAYKKVGVKKGRIILLKTDLSLLGKFEKVCKNEILKAHFNTLVNLIDLNQGTIVVSTSTSSLINTDKVFDPKNTPSESGILTEYIREQKGAIRSFHPFTSYAAIGKRAKTICEDVSRHAFGPETPEARMLELDVLCVSIGMHPHLTCSTVHHLEMVMGVPYRYPKEYVHPVYRNGRIRKECFYRYPWYRQCGIKKNRCAKIFERLYKEGLKIREAHLGRGRVFSYSLQDFYKKCLKIFKEDMFVYLDEIPKIKPYRR